MSLEGILRQAQSQTRPFWGAKTALCCTGGATVSIGLRHAIKLAFGLMIGPPFGGYLEGSSKKKTSHFKHNIGLPFVLGTHFLGFEGEPQGSPLIFWTSPPTQTDANPPTNAKNRVTAVREKSRSVDGSPVRRCPRPPCLGCPFSDPPLKVTNF